MISPLTDSYLQAEFHKPRDGSPVDLIVLHDMEAPERATMAEDLGRNWFARPRDKYGRPVYASTHYGVDSDSVVGYVVEERYAYGANRVANHRGLHIEHAGYARQSMGEWLDAFGRAMLDRSARLVAELCRRYGIPVRWLSAADLLAGRSGITTHAACTLAWGGDHTDPGPNFPQHVYMARVRSWFDDPVGTLPVLVPGDRGGKNSLGPTAGDLGSENGAPARMQRLLIEAGYDLGEFGPGGDGVDNDPGGLTWTAVRQFRRSNGLRDPDVAICDAEMWAVLEGADDVCPECPDPPDLGPLIGLLRSALVEALRLQDS